MIVLTDYDENNSDKPSDALLHDIFQNRVKDLKFENYTFRLLRSTMQSRERELLETLKPYLFDKLCYIIRDNCLIDLDLTHKEFVYDNLTLAREQNDCDSKYVVYTCHILYENDYRQRDLFHSTLLTFINDDKQSYIIHDNRVIFYKEGDEYYKNRISAHVTSATTLKLVARKVDVQTQTKDLVAKNDIDDTDKCSVSDAIQQLKQLSVGNRKRTISGAAALDAKFKCLKCQQLFTTKTNRERHMRFRCKK